MIEGKLFGHVLVKVIHAGESYTGLSVGDIIIAGDVSFEILTVGKNAYETLQRLDGCEPKPYTFKFAGSAYRTRYVIRRISTW